MNLIIMGAPGSGKGTQTHLISQARGTKGLSTGDILREAVDRKTEIGLKVSSYMEKGQLVPDQVIIELIADALDDNQYKNGFILDGFPRNEVQAQALDTMLSGKNIKIDAVLFLNVDNEKLGTRIKGRFNCVGCGASYHDSMKLPAEEGVCDNCGHHEFLRRNDDDIETLKKRVRIFHEETEPVIPYYEKAGCLYEIDGMESVDEVSKVIEGILCKVEQG